MSGRSRLAAVLALGGMVLLLAIIVPLAALNGSFSQDPLFLPINVAVVAGYLGVGGFIASRNPRNPIGWLMMLFALSFELGGGSSEYAIYVLVTNPGSAPLVEAAIWVNAWVFIGAGSLPLILLLFPTGRVPSPRWRWVSIALVAVLAILGVALAFDPSQVEIATTLHRANPLGIESLRGPIEGVLAIAGWAIGLLSILSLVALVLRFRRAQAEERQQIRWLASAALLGTAFLFLALLTGFGAEQGTLRYAAGEALFIGFLVAVGLGIPTACAFAVLRYRLWDLDLVVQKTAIYSIVAVVLTGLYLGLLGLAALAGLGPIPAVLLFVLTFNLVQRRTRRLADRIVYGRRATPFEVLSDFSERVGETYSVDDVLPRMTQLLAASTGAKEVRAWLHHGTVMHPAAVAPADAPPVGDVPLGSAEALGFDEKAAAFPVTHQGELLGAITLRMHAKDPMDPAKERLAQGVASQAGLALRNVRLVEELRASRRRIVSAQDVRAKQLEPLAVQLKLLEGQIERSPDQAKAMAEALQEAATTALEDLRDLARGIYPPLLADQGLAVALEAQARRSPVPVEVTPDGLGRYAPDIEAAVYFCCLEALNNIAKYADAGRASVSLSVTDDALVFVVRDDGRGFDPSSLGQGTGIQGMRDRLEAIGGHLDVSSSAGSGTTVEGRVVLV